MPVLVAIAAKSMLIAALAFGVLRLLRNRSAAERSWVAHIGLLALVLLALAPIALPRWTVEAPALFGTVEANPQPGDERLQQPVMISRAATVVTRQGRSEVLQSGNAAAFMSPALTATALYAVPAAILLLITALAVGRLIALRARADVVVDGRWLSALARAQRRMGFKHGTALLTSDDLSSPINWGLMRPVILLNTAAVAASGEAEAIIAHEFAHVARMDWIKLLLARIATALFWFNPLVWMLAREAHQLREEAADDAVLAADIVDTDYAQILVGVARHECSGLLLGAHGVAPSKQSLSRRIRRVLDSASVRGPVARPFAFGVFAGGVMVAAPLAALTLLPAGSTATARRSPAASARAAYAASEPADLPHFIATGVEASVNSAVARVAPNSVPPPTMLSDDPNIEVSGTVAKALQTARVARATAQAQARTDITAEVASAIHSGSRTTPDGLARLAAAGVPPEYVAAMRSASPGLRDADPSDFAGLEALGVTPDFTRELGAAGFGNLTPAALSAARAVGVTGSYARDMINAGVRPTLDDLVQLRTIGVPVDFVRRIRAAGHDVSDAHTLVELWAVDSVSQSRRGWSVSPALPQWRYNRPPLRRPSG